jgi:hypothetical protein
VVAGAAAAVVTAGVLDAGVPAAGDPKRPGEAAAGLAAPPKRPLACVVGVPLPAAGVLFAPNMPPEGKATAVVDVVLAAVVAGLAVVFPPPKRPADAGLLPPPNRAPPEAGCELAAPPNKPPAAGVAAVGVETPEAGAALDAAPPNMGFCSAGLAAVLPNKLPPAEEGVVLPAALPKGKPEDPVACPNRSPAGFEAEPNSELEAGAVEVVLLSWAALEPGVPLGVPNVKDMVDGQE